MDSQSARCAALISVHPVFANRILEGSKRAEFRRRGAARRITHLILYATAPVRAVVGVAEIERIVRGSPADLWHANASVAGIGRAEFFEYFSGATLGVAYMVARAFSCTSSMTLGMSGLPRAVPQAFQYVSDAALNSVLDACDGRFARRHAAGW
jgi:predicted transcriptional regulator